MPFRACHRVARSENGEMTLGVERDSWRVICVILHGCPSSLSRIQGGGPWYVCPQSKANRAQYPTNNMSHFMKFLAFQVPWKKVPAPLEFNNLCNAMEYESMPRSYVLSNLFSTMHSHCPLFFISAQIVLFVPFGLESVRWCPVCNLPLCLSSPMPFVACPSGANVSGVFVSSNYGCSMRRLIYSMNLCLQAERDEVGTLWSHVRVVVQDPAAPRPQTPPTPTPIWALGLFLQRKQECLLDIIYTVESSVS